MNLFQKNNKPKQNNKSVFYWFLNKTDLNECHMWKGYFFSSCFYPFYVTVRLLFTYIFQSKLHQHFSTHSVFRFLFLLCFSTVCFSIYHLCLLDWLSISIRYYQINIVYGFLAVQYSLRLTVFTITG